MKTYTIGKITLTQQALGVFIVQAIIAFTLLFTLGQKQPRLAVGAFISVLIFGSYATYLTNCTVVGKCKELAWFLVVLNAFSLLLIPMRLKMLRNTNRG